MSSRAIARSARRLLENNPLFLVSAALVLAATWLLNPSAPDGTRSLALLWRLFAAIQLYELSLLGAAAIFFRRGGLTRDARALALVLAPFLLDLTMTTATLLVAQLHFDGPEPWLLAASVVVVSVAKIGLAARFADVSLGLRAWAVLGAGPILVTGYPVFAYLIHEAESSSVSSGIALAGGLALAALVLLFGAGASAARPEAARTLRRLAPIALLVATIHTGATCWSHTGDILQVVGPALIALGPALALLAPGSRFAAPATALLVPITGGLLLGGSTPAGLLGLTQWQWGAAGVALAHGFELARRRELKFLATALVALDLLGSPSAGAFAKSVGTGLFEPIALGAIFLVTLARRSHPAAALGVLFLASARTLGANVFESWTSDAILALDVFGAGLIALAHRLQISKGAAASFRTFGVLFLTGPAWLVWFDGGHDASAALRFAVAAIVALLALRALTGLRVYALPVVLVPGFIARLAPRATTQSWGVIGLALAFVLVALGVVTTLFRERILAWLERPPRTETI